MSESISGMPDCYVGKNVLYFLAQLKGIVPQETMLEFELYVDSAGKLKFSMPMPDEATLPSPESVFGNS